MLLLTICVGSASTDTGHAATLVSEIAAILESGELVAEARAALAGEGSPALSAPSGPPLPALPPASGSVALATELP